MRDYKSEFNNRIEFIRGVLKESGAKGIVFGNSGGKDSALVGILCKAACENTLALILPCASKRNYGEDAAHGKLLSEKYGIETLTVDLTGARDSLVRELKDFTLNPAAANNIAPRLRMTALYAAAASRSMLVAGTGNRSEIHMGYFTKWGDGGYDFNPIADLTATEVTEFLRYLDAPREITDKPPSAGLFDGQTDEGEMGVSYKSIDGYLFTGEASPADKEIIDRYHRTSEHKRKAPLRYGETPETKKE